MAGSWRLARKERFKKVWLRRDLNEEERVKLNDLWEEAKEKNITEVEKMRLYWEVKDMKFRKWYIRREKSEEVSIVVEEGEQNLMLHTVM